MSYSGVQQWVGATPANKWAGGYGALGVIVPTPIPGQPNLAPDMQPVPPYCGSKFGLQQMLADLGFYAGDIDGKIGPQSLAAATAFATQQSVPIGGGITANFCQRLIDVWTATTAPPVAPPEPESAPSTGLRLRRVPRTIFRPSSASTFTMTGQTDGEAQPPANGNGGIMGWWSDQKTMTKVAIGVGGAAVIGVGIYALMGNKSSAMATPNRAMGPYAGRRSGKVITLKSGKRYGRTKPPKKYRKMGAVMMGDYAAPQQYGYPLIFRTPAGKINQKRTRTHVIAAKSKFSRFKQRYPMKLRRQIAGNINRASKRFGVGGKIVKP